MLESTNHVFFRHVAMAVQCFMDMYYNNTTILF